MSHEPAASMSGPDGAGPPERPPSGRAPARLRRELERALPDRPFALRFWDGSSVPATAPGPTIVVRRADAVAQVARAPGLLGLGRAYVAGTIDVDDLDALVGLLGEWKPRPIPWHAWPGLVAGAAEAGAVRRSPKRPRSELAPRRRRHTRSRDAEAVRHHYDVSNEFFALFLDESMTYSCGVFRPGVTSLEEAQEEKLDLVCRKLDLKQGQRLLDIGCGWGSLALHAAGRYGARVLGVTLSPPQAELARARVAEAGLDASVDIRVVDYRDADSEFDAVASIGMIEHVGERNMPLFFEKVKGSLAPAGRALIHGIALVNPKHKRQSSFADRYVFPDAHPLPLPKVLGSMEGADLEATHVEGFRPDYAETLRHWIERLDANLDEATRIAGEERVRVWRLYLRAARNGFLRSFTSVYQILCVPTRAGIPLGGPRLAERPSGPAAAGR